MKTRFTILLFWIFTSFCAYSQLPDGAPATDWTLQQINSDCGGYGQTWNLFTELNAGRHVIIDFSAVWCGPCWSYHNGGTLETLWDNHGPEGDNTLRVFYIEADCSTNDACLCALPACNSTTQGNWMAGTPYPVFSPTGSECTNVTSAYSIGYYPTLYAINAQYKTVWEVAQASVSVWESWLYESFTLAAEYEVTNSFCEGGSGAINLDVSGGKGNKTYLWSNGATTQDLLDIPQGTYSVTIRDANGYFIFIDDIVVGGNNNPLAISLSDIQHNTCFGDEEGYIELNVAGGLAPYTYQWSNGSTSKNIYNLAAGDYEVSATDGYDCMLIQSFTIEEPHQIIINANAFDASCGEDNGGIFLNPNGGTPPYQYLFNGQYYSSGDFYDLAPGTYSVGINDYNSCEITQEVVVESVPLPVSNAGPDKSLPCSGGTVQLDGSQSSAGAKWGYLWTTPNGHIVSGANTKTPIVDAIGTYNLKVTDLVYSCVAFDETVVTSNGNLPAVSITPPALLTCNVLNVTLDGSDSESGANITYLWTTLNGHIVSGQNEAIAICDQPGDYTLAVTNISNSCVNFKTVTVNSDYSVPSAISNNPLISCGQPNVQICIEVNGNYQSVQWANGSQDLCISVNAPGQYDYTVTGLNGCLFNGFSTVTGDNTLPTAIIAEHGKLQCGASSVQIEGTGSSTGNEYLYLWSTPNGHIAGPNNTFVVTVDQPGKYFLNVTNNLTQCVSIDSTIVEIGPSAPVAEFTQNVNFNTATLTGIENLYSTSVWVSNGITITGTNASFSYNDNGVYAVCHTITNDCGEENICMDVNITGIEALSFNSIYSDVKCFGANDGIITVSPVGGIGTYTVNWTGPENYNASGNTISGLKPGIYTMVLTDEGNHSVTQTFNIAQPALITMESVVTKATGNQSNGAIDLTVAGGIQPYTYLWSNNATTQDISNLSPGNYTVTVTDGNSCVSIATYTVGTTASYDLGNDLVYKVYPNPTNDKIYIDINAAELSGSEMRITDINGKVVLRKQIGVKDNTVEIDLSDFNSGVFMMKIENSRKSVVRKLVRI
jgi:hypothetical protein